MSTRLDDIIAAFQSVDDDMRIELLLDYARKLPPLDPRFHEARDAGLGRVEECQTPVFMFVEQAQGKLLIHVDVADEAPTVRGLVSLLCDAFHEQPIEDIEQLPDDLLQQLRLANVIRMNRAIGFAGVVGRIKKEAANAQEAKR